MSHRAFGVRAAPSAGPDQAASGPEPRRAMRVLLLALSVLGASCEPSELGPTGTSGGISSGGAGGAGGAGGTTTTSASDGGGGGDFTIVGTSCSGLGCQQVE